MTAFSSYITGNLPLGGAGDMSSTCAMRSSYVVAGWGKNRVAERGRELLDEPLPPPPRELYDSPASYFTTFILHTAADFSSLPPRLFRRGGNEAFEIFGAGLRLATLSPR